VNVNSTLYAVSVSQAACGGVTTFGGAVNTTGAAGIDLTGNAFTVNGTVATAGTGPVVIDNSGLLDINTGADFSLDGAFLQTGSGNTALAANITTSSDDIDFTGTLYIDGGITISTTGGLTLTFPVDVHIYAPGAIIEFPVDNLTCNNLVLYAGTLDMGGNNLRTSADLVLLGGIGGAGTYDDDDPTGAADVFAYDNPQRNTGDLDPFLADYNVSLVASIPGGAAFTEADYDGTLNDLTGSVVTVDGNFYTNGCSLLATAGWSLRIRDNDDATLSFAEAYNMTVENCTVNIHPSDTVAGNIAAVESVTVTPAETHWRTARTAHVPAGIYTVYDNVIRLEFDELLENSNGEIADAVGYVYLDGGFTTPFTHVYSDRECQSPLTAADGDVDVFYIRIAGTTWNTDAVSDNPGAAGSTDRHDVQQTNQPQIHFVKSSGTTDPARSYILADRYKNRIEALALSGAGDVADQCSPVLVEVDCRIAPHSIVAMQNDDGHNYFALRYSEPVDIGTLASGADASNQRSSDILTSGGGDIVDGGNTVTVQGLFEFGTGGSPAELVTDSRDAVPPHSLWRVAADFGGDGNTHGLRYYLVGYSTGAAPDFEWPGYIESITDPTGIDVRALSDPDITDADGNLVEQYDDLYDGVEPKDEPAITSGANWDTVGPGFATYETGFAEIVTRANPVSGLINRIEFHVLDDWATDDGPWNPETDHPDPVSGVRDTTLTDVDAFSVEEVGIEPLTSTYNLSYATDINNPLFGTVNVQDDAYFALNIQEAHGWDLLSELYISYDSTISLITDLAGNLLPSQITPIRSIERIPPYISLSLATVGGDKVYVKFSEPVFGFDGANLEDLDINHLNPAVGNSTTIIDLDILSTGDNGGAMEAFLYLSSPLTENLSVSGTLKAKANSVVDKLENAMLETRVHRVTDVASGVIEPVWASDGIHADTDSSLTSSLRDFDGTGALMDRDITLEASILADQYTGLPVQLYYDVSPSDTVTTESGLWLPSFVSIALPGQNNDARGVAPSRSQGAVRDFLIPASDSEIVPGADLEFILKLGNLFAARSLDPNDPRQLAPWVIPIRDIRRQTGGVTILNNVINPLLNDETIITYELRRQGMVTINVFSLSGDVVKIIHRGPQGTGSYTYSWDGTNRAGMTVARGIYFIRVVGPDIDEYRKVMVVK